MAAPRVSILITSYNREEYISESLESVLSQAFEDIEVVVVDDASSDNTVAVARSFAHDPRVRIVVSQTRRGDYANRNYAATFARGEFLKYHDSDDVMYSHCLTTMVSGLVAEPAAAFSLSSGH